MCVYEYECDRESVIIREKEEWNENVLMSGEVSHLFELGLIFLLFWALGIMLVVNRDLLASNSPGGKCRIQNAPS